jgi:hypothetical protein
MGQIKKHIPVKLFVGIITLAQPRLLNRAKKTLEKKFGRIDAESDIWNFDFTDYYQREMGKNLVRQFVSFKKLIDPGRLAHIKTSTNKIEEFFCRKNGTRRVNLDPGYITQSSLVLATTKAFGHRIYLGKGIFAEVTLRYQKGDFLPHEWTYPDYRTDKYRNFFKKIRKIYKMAGTPCCEKLLSGCKVSPVR